MNTVSSLKYKSNYYLFSPVWAQVWLQSKIYYPLCEGMWQRLPYQMNFNIGSLFIKAHTLLPIQVCFPFSGGLTTFSRSPPRAPSPFHSTQCSCYPAILCICLVLYPKSSLSFKLGQGRACLIGTARNLSLFVFFWGRRHSPSLYIPAGPLHKNPTDQP